MELGAFFNIYNCTEPEQELLIAYLFAFRCKGNMAIVFRILNKYKDLL